SIRGVDRHLFVPERHVFDPESLTRVDQRVVCMAALAEHFRDAFLFQAFGDEHRSSHGGRSPYDRLSVTSRSSVISCMAYFGPSRPMPLCLTPANGIRSARLLDDSFR